MFNENHPELKIGEMFLSNMHDSDIDYCHIRYETKRKGNVAYNIYGEIIKDMYPIFIERREFIKVQNGYKHDGF